VRGLATVAAASIPVVSVGFGDQVWTRGGGEECRGRGGSRMEGKMQREREERGGSDDRLPL
jgi:hypothetical protein